MRVITVGTFDILHYGHLSMLKFCRELAGEGKFIVGLNTDNFVEVYKGKAPTLSFKERKITLEALPWIDKVVENCQPEFSMGKLLLDEKIDVSVIGSDWLRKDILKQWDVTADWLDKHNIAVCYYPFYRTKNISSSIIKERVRSA